jgi:hypothetical protein
MTLPVLPPSSHRIVQSWHDFTTRGQNAADRLGLAGDRRRPTRVALVDLGAWIGELDTLIERLNAAQMQYEFFRVRQAVPLWLTSQVPKLQQWLESELRRPLTVDERSSLEPHVILDDYQRFGARIQKQYGIPYVFGLTPAPVTSSEDAGSPGKFWDYVKCFIVSHKKVGLISTDGVLEFATKAKRPFVIGIGVLVIGAILAESTNTKFHEKEEADTGCIFDYCDKRNNLVLGIQRPHIEESCLFKLPPGRRAAAMRMVEVLSEWGRGD